jgi:hypothetical protein
METNLAFIDPFEFEHEMDQHWTTNLNNHSSPALRRVWRQIAATFKYHVLAHRYSRRRKKWSILEPETGTGKSQGTMLYSALLSKYPDERHPGVLIVSRLIDDCETMAHEINKSGARETAVAFHSAKERLKQGLAIGDLWRYPVVCITHRAYENALDYLGKDAEIQNTFGFFHKWFDRTRALVVIDENLDIIDHCRGGLDDLRNVYGAVPSPMRERFPEEVRAIKRVIEWLEEAEAEARDKEFHDTIVREMPMVLWNPPDLTEFRMAFKEGFSNARLLRHVSPSAFSVMREKYNEAIRSLDVFFKTWSYLSKVDGELVLNSARLIVPEKVKGAVVMDATASQNRIYETFERVELIPNPGVARNYGNVKLHVSWGHKTGKRSMGSHAKKACRDLLSELARELQPVSGRKQKALIVTHLDVEPHLRTFDPEEFEMHTTHYGEHTGLNKWDHCDTCVIFGLHHMPTYWPANTFMACRGVQTGKWLKSEDRPFKGHKDILKALAYGQLIVDTVQAINRVRCRKVIDGEGNCPKTDILLPENDLGRAVLEGIQTEMPGIHVTEWEFSGHRRKIRRGDREKALLAYAEKMLKGRRERLTYVRNILDIGPKTMEKMRSKLRDISSSLCRDLAALGVRYLVEGKGQAQRAYLVKD